ncbi:hypothetical protein L901_17920 [Agrobacterium sp. D14]|nr:hypothetical protein L901_17920 [Agrobacterium sp. D14]
MAISERLATSIFEIDNEDPFDGHGMSFVRAMARRFLLIIANEKE